MKNIVMILSVAGLAGSAVAAPLPPGGTIFPVAGVPAGGSLVTSGSVAVTAATFSATVFFEVRNEGAANPLGGLTFFYAVRNNASSSNQIGRFTVNGYGNWLVDGNYASTSVGVTPGLFPTVLDRDVANGGDTVGASFEAFGPGAILPGQTSFFVAYRTNAPDWRDNTVQVIDGSIGTNVVPAPFIPAPGAAALLGLGALAVGRRRR
jgi:uncharacterized protein (TIGR03382 family)